ncbi:MAG: response regulator transcription factor [Cystobacterineae bacterium]|nr:response regulator transcription factor [Cystobacterineae bacterium]
MNMPPNSPPKNIRVYIVEDQIQILKSLLKLLENASGIELVGTALSGESAVVDIPELRPNVVLLDLELPRMDGIAVTREIKTTCPSAEVLIFTVFDNEEKVLEAIRAGASGYLLKASGARKLLEAIHEVHAGGTIIQPNLARKLLRHFHNDTSIETTEEPAPTLTQREQEILLLIAKGVSNAEAAKLLNLSKATIRTHLEHIYRKLDVANRVEAVTEGLRKGIIQL